MTTENQKPVATLKDRFIKADIWKNGSKNGDFYSVSISRTYKDGNDYKSANSFSGSDTLVAARLLQGAYDKVVELEKADYESAKPQPTPS